MQFIFEMTEKYEHREVVTRTDDAYELLHRMATAIKGGTYSGFRGEIEIGVQGGPQILLKVMK